MLTVFLYNLTIWRPDDRVTEFRPTLDDTKEFNLEIKVRPFNRVVE